MMFDKRLTTPGPMTGSTGKALKAFGWSELTARINAARDLRQILLEESSLLTSSFGDAAAGYFASAEEGKRYVNHKALGGRKCPGGMENSAEGKAATGDREK